MRHVIGKELLKKWPVPSSKVLSAEDRSACGVSSNQSAIACHGDSQPVPNRAGLGILRRDLSGRVLFANHDFCTLVGLSAEELHGASAKDITHPDDSERSDAAYREQSLLAEPYQIEERYVRSDGTAVWCSVHISFVLDENGRPLSSIATVSDITARRCAERSLRESEEHYRNTVELSPQIAWIAAADGSILQVSSRWHTVTGIPQSAALGQQWVQALHPDDVAPTRAQWEHSIATHEPVDVSYRLRGKDGAYRWFRARAVARLNGHGEVTRWYGSLEDIHDRRVIEDALRDSEERFRLAAQAAGLGIWDYDAVSGKREWSNEFKAMLGLDRDVEPDVLTALDLVVPADQPLLQSLVNAAHSGDTTTRFEGALRIRRANDGAERCMQTGGWRMYTSSGRLTRVLVTVRDVTEERTAEDRIRWTANHDAMTGVPNRAFFAEQLDTAIRAALPDSVLALILLDVDRLKEINDTHGHDAGDMLLRTFAARLRTAFGAKAVIGRLGGDEFGVVLDGMEGDSLHRFIDDALRLMATPFEYEGQTLDTQATAGLATYPAHGTTFDDLLKASDIALYVGKSSQRGALSIFESTMRAGVQKRTSMLNVARSAIREGRIFPFYQPKVELATGRVVGFEALLRWRHDSLGIQAPDTISAAFEDTSLAIALGDQMYRAVARDLRRWLDLGLEPGRVAINLAPAEFRHGNLIGRVLEPFELAGVPLDRVEIEITETVLLCRDTDKVASILEAFRENKARIALDDFGTGYASLTHLKAFPVDVIKIDRSFVSNLRDGSDDAAIVDAMVGLAHRLRIEVVAEGVQAAEQAKYLQRKGCAYAQGHLFSPAMSAEQAEALLVSGFAGARQGDHWQHLTR